jgi:hypothetical protein
MDVTVNQILPSLLCLCVIVNIAPNYTWLCAMKSESQCVKMWLAWNAGVCFCVWEREREICHVSSRPMVICVMYCSRELNQYVLLVANSPSIFVDTSCRDTKRPRLVVHRGRDSCMKNGALGEHSYRPPSPTCQLCNSIAASHVVRLALRSFSSPGPNGISGPFSYTSLAI